MALQNSNLKELTLDKDVKAYIYQQFVDFEPFITAETFLSLQLKDPMKLLPEIESGLISGLDKSDLKKMIRVAIILEEDGATIEAEGLSENIYSAINMAKNEAVKKLISIQDKVISNQERAAQIYTSRISGGMLH